MQDLIALERVVAIGRDAQHRVARAGQVRDVAQCPLGRGVVPSVSDGIGSSRFVAISTADTVAVTATVVAPVGPPERNRSNAIALAAANSAARTSPTRNGARR